jgi:polyisoprenoid-binding protein YceI
MQLINIKNALIVLGILIGIAFSTTPKLKDIYSNKTYYVLDTAKSKLHWNCMHFGELKFNRGTIITDNKGEPINANFSIDMTSVKNIDIENKLLQGTLENVLKSAEFFNANKFPLAQFESDTIYKIDNTNSYKFRGDYIIFDNGICATFEGTVKVEMDTLYMHAKNIIINRTDWGIYYLSANNPKPKDEESGFVVSDTILIDAHIQAFKSLK